jgi:hypothetical protein
VCREGEPSGVEAEEGPRGVPPPKACGGERRTWLASATKATSPGLGLNTATTIDRYWCGGGPAASGDLGLLQIRA